MRLQFETTKDLEDFASRMINVMAHERYWTKRWMRLFGFTNRNEMESWQQRADSLISELKITDQDLRKRFEVTIKPKENENSN